MVSAKVDEMLRRNSCGTGENLWVDMTAELLDPYLIKSRSRGFYKYALSAYVFSIHIAEYLTRKRAFVVARSNLCRPSFGCIV